jgi:hypothetical protein
MQAANLDSVTVVAEVSLQEAEEADVRRPALLTAETEAGVHSGIN